MINSFLLQPWEDKIRCVTGGISQVSEKEKNKTAEVTMIALICLVLFWLPTQTPPPYAPKKHKTILQRRLDWWLFPISV